MKNNNALITSRCWWSVSKMLLSLKALLNVLSLKVSSFPSLKQSTLSLRRMEGRLALESHSLQILIEGVTVLRAEFEDPYSFGFFKTRFSWNALSKIIQKCFALARSSRSVENGLKIRKCDKTKKIVICHLPDASNLRTPSSENLAKDFDPQISPTGDFFTELPLQNFVTILSFVQRPRSTRRPQNLTSQQACFRSITSIAKLFSKFAKEPDDKQCENVNWVLFNKFKNCWFFLTMPRLVGGLHAPSFLTCRFAVEELALEQRNFISWVMQAWRM